MKQIEFYIEKSANFFNAVSAVAVVLMMTVTTLDVVMRFFRISFPGAYDMVGLLGAVVVGFALTYTSIQRGHIAVDFVYQKVPDRYKALFDIFNELVGFIFFALLAWQCFEYAAALRDVGEVSLTIQIPIYPFVAGIGVNCVLLSLYLLLHLMRAVQGGIQTMTPTVIGLLGLALLVLLLFTRMPVGFLMAIVGFAGFGCIISFDGALQLIATDVYSVFSSYNLTVIPLFVFMGQLAFHSGISTRLFDAAYKCAARLPGGLAIATIGACAGFSAICGSTNATAATMAAATLPEMKRYNYKPGLATGVVAAGGSLGILIPPSVIFIVYGIMTEQSIGKLFLAGIIPGILLALMFVAAIIIWVTLRPELAPPGPQTTFKEKVQALAGLGETLLLFVLVMGGLFSGIFTPTEAGGIGAFGTLLIALVRRKIDWQGFKAALNETTRISCMIMVIVAGATIFSHFLAVSRIPFDAANWIAGLDMHRSLVMLIIILLYVVGGCFIDALALIMLTTPIFYPVIISLGYDPIWFGVLVVMVTQIGVITPPVGINVYVVSGVARDVPLHVIFKGVIPLLIALIVATLLLIPFPQIALFLPGLMK